MIAIIVRIILFLVPVLLLVMWLQWRMKKDRTAEELAADIAQLRKRLVFIVGGTVVAVLIFAISDDRTGDAGTEYVPPHMENGKLVPGEFKPKDDDPDE